MSEKPTPQASEAQAQAQAQRLQLARAFNEVFGSPQGRSSSQRRVVEHLEKCASEGENIYRFDARDGIGIIAAGLHRDGAQSIIRIINRQISHAQEAQPEKKPKPVTKR